MKSHAKGNRLPAVDTDMREGESVIARDDRKPITDASQSPFNRLCQLEITTARGERQIGTGWVIGRRMVITAGHCVYRHNEKNWIKQVVINFGRNGSSILDQITVTREHLNPFDTTHRFITADFGAESTAAFDFGSILLPRTVNPAVKRMGFSSRYTDDRLLNGIFNIFGYPVDKGATTLWGQAGRLSRIRDQILTHEIDTFGGQSGSPVISVTYGPHGVLRYIAVGIHNSNSPGANLATRITPSVFNYLRAWKQYSRAARATSG